MLNLNIPTVVFVIINMMVLYFILKKFLFKPVTEFMEKRKKSITDSLDEIKRGKAEAQELKKSYESRLKEARNKADKIIRDAHDIADKEYDAIIKKAKQEAQDLILKAKEDIEKERMEMVKDMKNQVASIALAAAAKVIEANMDTERNRALVEKFIDKAGVA